MAEVTLLMAIHCHQPVGNFEFVFEEACAKAYEPFVRVLERHPQVRLALHYSGPLLEWLIAKRPPFMERLRALIARGQVELLASGYYEPILPLIPEADRQGQIALMRRLVQTQCGTEPAGLWLTERVWEPDLARTNELDLDADRRPEEEDGEREDEGRGGGHDGRQEEEAQEEGRRGQTGLRGRAACLSRPN